MPKLKMLSTSKVLCSSSSVRFANFSLLLFLALFFDFSLSQPIDQQNSQQELLEPSSSLQSVENNDNFVAPFQQQKQQRWLSVRPFQEYRRTPHTDELGLLLQYLDNKRNAPSLTEEDGNGRQTISGSPLGTMRFGKREYSKSPLGTMRFG